MRSLGIDLGTRRAALAERGRSLPAIAGGLEAALRALAIEPGVVDAIVAVPPEEAEATLVRVQSAGVARVRGLMAPIAIALTAPGRGRVAIVQLGAHRTELAIVERAAWPLAIAEREVIGVGGADLDRAIARLVTERVRRETGWDLGAQAPDVALRLERECEHAKLRLTREERTWIDVAHVDPAAPTQAATIALDRARLAVLAADALAPVLARPAERVEALIIAGRGALVAGLPEAFAARWGSAPRLEPDAAAIGASLAFGRAEEAGLTAEAASRG